MITPTPKELAFDTKSRIFYLPGYALDALALVGEGRGDLACLTTIYVKLATGTIPLPKDMETAQKGAIIRPTSGDSMWLLNVRDAYAELEKVLIP